MGSKKSSKSSKEKGHKGFFFLLKNKDEYKDYNGGNAYIKANKLVLVKDGHKNKTVKDKKAIKLCKEHSFEKIYVGEKVSIWKDGNEKGTVYVFCSDDGKYKKFSDAKTFDKESKEYGVTDLKIKDGNAKFKINGTKCSMEFSTKPVEFDTKSSPPFDDKNGAITRNTLVDTRVPESSSFQLTILNLLKSIDSKMDLLIAKDSSN